MIIGVDFDGTLCKNAWPDIHKATQSLPHKIVLWWVKRQQKKGHEIVLVTMREDRPLKDKDYLTDAIAWCMVHGLSIQRVNVNTEEMIKEYGPSRKVFVDRYIDDTNIGAIGWILRKA